MENYAGLAVKLQKKGKGRKNGKKKGGARKRHGELITQSRVERVRRLDDDLPEISEEYKKIMGI